MRRDLSSWLGTLGMTGRKATYRRSRTNHTLKSRNAAHAISLSGGEPLDPRKMLAVTAQVVDNVLLIGLSAENDIAGLVLNTGTSKYEVYDNTTLVDSFDSSEVKTISVSDTAPPGEDLGQVFEVRDGGAIAASLSVQTPVETTKIFSDIDVTNAFPTDRLVISSPTIILDDATPAGALLIETANLDIEFGGVVTIIDDSQVTIGTDTGAGSIAFFDDILGGGEDGSGTLTLAAGTGAITFGGDIGGSGVGEELHGVLISSAASVSATGKFHLADALGDGFTDGLTIGDGVNNVNFSNGGEITGFGEDGAGIWFEGSSTNSTISSFLLEGNTYGIYLGGGVEGEADLSGTVIDDNVIGEDDFGIYLDNVAGNLNGEDVLLIGGTAGNFIAANGEDGIYGWSSTGVEIRNNTIIANGLDGFGAGSGISLEGGGEYLITENTIGEDGVGPFLGLGNSYDGITINGEDGFYSYAGTEIRTNDIEYNAAYGVRVQGVTLDTGEDSILIFDNTIANNGFLVRTPPPGGGMRIDGSENIRIINNFIGFNGGGAGNGIDIVNGSHGTAVFSNQIIQNSNHGIYVEDSSTAANPVQIGDVLPIDSSTATTVVIDGDARAAILPGQQIGLAYVVDPTNVATATLITRTVLTVSYDAVNDATTLTFSNDPGVPGSPYAVTLGNYILGNGEDSLSGSGISVFASATVTPAATVTATITVGSSPRGVAVSPDGARVYASNYGGDSVSAIDAATGLVVATINVGDGPIGVALTPDGFRAYVANEFSGYVSVIDTNPANSGTYNTVISTIGLGATNPNAVAFTPNGARGYVSNGGAGTVSVIDTDPTSGTYNTVIATITVGGAAAAVAITPDGTRAYVPNDAGGAFVSVIDTDPTSEDYNTVLGSIRVGNAPVAVAVSPDGTRVYVTNKDDGTVSVINTENNLVIGTIAGFSAPVGVAFSPDSTLAYVTNKDNGTVSVVDTASSTVIGTITVGSAPGAVAVSSDGGSTYVTNEGGGTVSVIDNIAGVEGIEILGNVVLGNELDGIRLASTRAARSGDLSDALIAGNFVGRDPVGEDSPNDFGNLANGITVINGNGIAIQANYVAANVNGIEIITSQYVDIGEDGLGNYIARNNEDGVRIWGSQFVTVVDNEIAFNAEDGIDIEAYEGTRSADILIAANWIHDNASRGIEILDSVRVDVIDNLIEDNGRDGILARDGEDVYVGFSIIRGHNGDGVHFDKTTGIIEGNEIYDNGEDGIYVNGVGVGEDASFQVNVLGNIIRDNADDGVHFANGKFVGEDFEEGESPFSLVSGNTIERNGDNGVELQDAYGVLVGGPSVVSGGIETNPSDINFINLNGYAGVYATGETLALVVSNEIESNGRYGVENDGAEDLLVGYPVVGLENTIRRNGIAGVYAHGVSGEAVFFNNDISENPIGVMLTSASNMLVGGPNDFPGEEEIQFGNRIFDNGEGVRATGDFTNVAVVGNLIEGNLTGATLASARGLGFGAGVIISEEGTYGNIVQNNNEGLRASGDLTDTVVAGNQFFKNSKVGIALQSAKNLTVGGEGEDAPNYISGSPVGLSASGTMTGTEVVFNQVAQNVIGIALSKATGMLVGGNAIDHSAKYGVSITGNNADTRIVANTVTNTGDGPYAGVGISLSNARNVEITRNTVDGSSLAGLYATGNTSGTVVENNLFTDNRIGMFLENATNAVFGGLGKAEGNTIVGGGDPFLGEFRDGILVTGTSTKSSITGTDISDASTGVILRGAQGIEITETLIDGSTFFGLNATGDLAGSKFHSNSVVGTTGIGGGLGHGMYLDNAKNLQVYDNLGEDSFGSGIYVTGDTTGTTVTSNLLDGNRVGISLVNATNAVIGGLGEDDGNTVIGGSDAANAVYRDGIQVIGTSTGSSIKGTDVSDVTTGVTLENATDFLGEDNTITGAEFLGVNASGTLTGSQLQNNTVSGTGGLGALGHGIYLANAAGLSITGNLVGISTGGGLYATGKTTGTTVYGNDFTGNRVGIYLVNATDAVIGGANAGEDNGIAGGGDASNGDFRDGILASGTLTGSSITETVITNAATGITLSAATGLTITNVMVTGSQVFGLNANGVLTGTKVQSSMFAFTSGGAGGGAGVLLSAAQSLEITEATITDNVIGLLANGDCSGSSVIDTTWSGNGTNVINTSTGVPPLDIDPLPPAT
jgi:YVTN family beta-propeller protein/parallel beta-helix repeat protein